ncbi:MAG: hypothetical protein WAK96_00155 [Desulfobaccales bacterium]
MAYHIRNFPEWSRERGGDDYCAPAAPLLKARLEPGKQMAFPCRSLGTRGKPKTALLNEHINQSKKQVPDKELVGSAHPTLTDLAKGPLTLILPFTENRKPITDNRF